LPQALRCRAFLPGVLFLDFERGKSHYFSMRLKGRRPPVLAVFSLLLFFSQASAADKILDRALQSGATAYNAVVKILFSAIDPECFPIPLRSVTSG